MRIGAHHFYSLCPSNVLRIVYLMISFFHLQRFKDNDIEVKRKDGIILLRELAAEVKNFMDFKRNAVMVSENLRFLPYNVQALKGI